MSDAQRDTEPVGLTGSRLVQLLKDNLSVFSLAGIVVGVGLAVTFLAAYLLRFDFRLFWFVQYTDVLTSRLLDESADREEDQRVVAASPACLTFSR